MKSAAQNIIRPVPASDVAARVGAIDWAQATSELDAQGCAVLKGLLSPDECRALAALYPDDGHFRSKVVMGRHGFGRGEYKYFSYPLPDLIAAVAAGALCAASRRGQSLERGHGHRYPLSRKP